MILFRSRQISDRRQVIHQSMKGPIARSEFPLVQPATKGVHRER